MSDFPVLLTEANLDEGASSAFWTAVDTNGYRIRIATANDGTGRIPMEVVTFDKSAKTMQIRAKPSSMTTGTNTIYITLDSSLGSFDAVDATNGSENVWNSTYKSVLHMEQDPSGSAPQILDSTANDTHWTTNGSMTGGDLVSAKFGNGLDFDGTDDYLSIPAGMLSGSYTQLYISFWINMSSVTKQWIVTKNALNDFGIACFDTNGVMRVYSGSNFERWIGNTGDFTTGLNKFDCVYDEAVGGYWTIYKNGSALTPSSNNADAIVKGSSATYIGLFDGTARLASILDEFIIAETAPSADWIAAEYANQSDPATFFVPQGGVTPGGGSSTILPQIMQNYYG